MLKKLFVMRISLRLFPLAAGIITALALAGIIFTISHGHSARIKPSPKPVSAGIVSAYESPASGRTANSAGLVSKNKADGAAPKPGTVATTVLKSTVNQDGTTTREIANYLPVPFSSKIQKDANLQRGKTQVRAGQNGIETVVYSVTLDHNGKETSRKLVSDSITKQPIDQITLIGVSDFNLNKDTWQSTEFGEMCSPSDYGSAGDGCVGVPSDQHFSAVNISGINYVYCISSASGTCGGNAAVNIQPVIGIQPDDTFIYLGSIYQSDPRAGGGVAQPLTAGLCSQYGLACGSW